jgi:hypothetical protein
MNFFMPFSAESDDVLDTARLHSHGDLAPALRGICQKEWLDSSGRMSPRVRQPAALGGRTRPKGTV